MLSNLFTLPGDPRRYRATSRQRPAEPVAASRHETVTVRESVPADFAQLARLAGLDSKRLPDGPFVVAEVGGRLLAARSLAGGAVLADPFEHTANLVSLLELRAAQLLPADAPQATARRRFVPRTAG